MASPIKQGPQARHTSNTAPAPTSNPVVYPSTPVQSVSDTPRRYTRKSGQKFEVHTLPGTRWDELEIERRRESRRGRDSAAGPILIPSLNRLSLREKSAQLSAYRNTQSSEETKYLDVSTGRHQDQLSVQQSANYSSQSVGESLVQNPATASSPLKRHPRNRFLQAKQQAPSERGGQSASEVRLSNQSPSLIAERIPGDLPANMARRPGRNQVDYVAELKETINESLSKLSDIQDKLAPLGQQIVALEEELKAKESDSSKLGGILPFL